MNKQLVFALTTRQSPHLELTFKLIDDAINTGEMVTVLDYLDMFIFRHEVRLRSRRSIRLFMSRVYNNFIIKYLLIRRKRKYFRHHHSIKYHRPSLLKQVDALASKVGNITNEEFRITQGYISTELGVRGIGRWEPNNHLISSLRLVRQHVVNKASALSFGHNTLVVFNGRLPLEKTLVDLFETFPETNIIYHEVNNYFPKFRVQKYPIHSLKDYKEDIIKTIYNNKKDLNDCVNQYNKLISISAKKYVTFYVSSVDEYAFWFEEPVNQLIIIEILLSSFFVKKLNDMGLEPRIRVHPNIINKDILQRNYWDHMYYKYPQYIIPYCSKKNSLKLAQESILTISVGSSLAAESVLLDIPHILVGDQNVYWNLDICKNVSENELNHKYLINLINNYDLEKKYETSVNRKIKAAAALMYFKNCGVEITFPTHGKGVYS